jgi:hypothetical protein
MIETNYTQTVNVQRLTKTTGNKKTYSSYLTGISCHMQPMDSNITQDIEGGFGKDKLMFCAIADIREGDRIIHGSDVYRIVGLEKFDDFFGKTRHMEIILRIFKQ